MYKSIIFTLLSVASIQAYGPYDKCSHNTKLEGFIASDSDGNSVACANFDPNNPEMCPMRLHYPRKSSYNRCKWNANIFTKHLKITTFMCSDKDQLDQFKESYEKKGWMCNESSAAKMAGSPMSMFSAFM